MMKSFIRKRRVKFSVFLLVTAAFTFHTQAFQAEETARQQEPEVVDVVGEKPLAFFRNNLHAAEDSFFGMMNESVEDEDFKVTCKTKRIQAFSRLKDRVCEANFVSRIMSGETRDSSDTGANLPSSSKLRKELEKKQREYVEVLVEKVNGDPELLQAYQKMELAKQQYQQAKDS